MKTTKKKDHANTGKQVYCETCTCYVPTAALLKSHESGKKHQKLLNKQKSKVKALQCSVYVRGFTKQTDLETRLKNLFNKYGTIKEIYVDKEKGNYALVQFEEQAEVEKLLLEKDQPFLDGQKLLIKPRKVQEDKQESEDKSAKSKEKEANRNSDVSSLVIKLLNDASVEYKEVSSMMNTLVEEMQLTKNDITIRETLCKLLEEVFKEVYPDCKVLPFGSSVTQLGCKGCDLDLTITTDELPNMQTRNQPTSTVIDHCDESCSIASSESKFSSNTATAITEVSEVLRRFAPGCKNVFPLKSAHCPIIKFQHKDSGLNCDLSINNRLALKNSKLISLYSKMDPRFRPLAYTLRLWAKSKGIAGKSGMQLTQYAIAVMLIHFLQQCQPAVLACLQEVDRNSEMEDEQDWIVDGWRCYFYSEIGDLEKSKNTMNCDELLVGFFQFFSQYDFKHRVISISTSSQLTRTSFKQQLTASGIDYAFKEGPVCIVDPFELTHNIAQNISEEGLENFLSEIKDSLSILKRPVQYNHADGGNNISERNLIQKTCPLSTPDFIKLFAPKESVKEGKKKRKTKLKYVFDVYHGDDFSFNDSYKKCCDVILQIMEEDLRMHCKICYDDGRDEIIRNESESVEQAVPNVVAVEANQGEKDAQQSLEDDPSASKCDSSLRHTSISAVTGRKRMLVDGGCSEQPARKTARISSKLSVSPSSSVQIHATAWANTWTHRRHQRRLINVLKSDKADVVGVVGDMPSPATTSSGVLVSTSQTSSGTSCSVQKVVNGNIEILTANPCESGMSCQMQPVAQSTNEELAMSDITSGTSIPVKSDIRKNNDELAAHQVGPMASDSEQAVTSSNNETLTSLDCGPIITADIKITKNSTEKQCCRISVQMVEARNRNSFHTFFAFFKKQVILKFKQ